MTDTLLAVPVVRLSYFTYFMLWLSVAESARVSEQPACEETLASNRFDLEGLNTPLSSATAANPDEGKDLVVVVLLPCGVFDLEWDLE
jgi:hypothetical protein